MRTGRPDPRRARSFKEAQAREGAFAALDRGIQTVSLERIVGSVSRYRDFDARFRLKKNLPRERLQFIRGAMRAGRPLPPVELYRIKDEYFVMDGNHRIAVAKELGFRELDARVIEFLPARDTPENLLYREKRAFQEQTGLAQAIELTEEGQYAVLLDQVRGHQGYLAGQGQAVSLEEAAADWHRTVFGPLTGILERSELLGGFPGRTAADLYAYISVHQWARGHSGRYGSGIDAFLTANMEEFRMKMQSGRDYPEMLRRFPVFVLINISARQEARILERLFQIEEVREVHSVHGSIDVVLKAVLTRDLLSSDAEVISRFVQEQVRRIPGVLSTQTLIPGLSRVKPEQAGAD
jgi:DNA-binding Lrp family transcriptional regulator